jgi:hypothetical protein
MVRLLLDNVCAPDSDTPSILITADELSVLALSTVTDMVAVFASVSTTQRQWKQTLALRRHRSKPSWRFLGSF